MLLLTPTPNRLEKGEEPPPKPTNAQWVVDAGKRAFDNNPHYFVQYTEVITEYFYMAIFSVLNPLAPFMALLVNSFTMRLQAKWLLQAGQRQIPKRFVTGARHD